MFRIVAVIMCAMHPMTSNIGDLKKWVPLSFVVYFQRRIIYKEHALLCSYLLQTCTIGTYVQSTVI